MVSGETRLQGPDENRKLHSYFFATTMITRTTGR